MGRSSPEVTVKDKGQTNAFPQAPRSLVSKPCIPLFCPSLNSHPKSPIHSFLYIHSFIHSFVQSLPHSFTFTHLLIHSTVHGGSDTIS